MANQNKGKRTKMVALPIPVKNLVATVLGTSIELTWDADPNIGIGTYKIYKSTTNDVTTATYHAQTQTSYVHVNLTQSTTYYYWLSKVVGGKEGVKTEVVSASTGAYRTNIILPGTIGSPTSYFLSSVQNIMTLESLSPGDVIILQAGYYSSIDLDGYYEDITITSENTGTVYIRDRVNFGPLGKHHKLLSNLAVSKNIVIGDDINGYFGSSSRGSGNIIYRNLDFQNNVMGIQVEHRDSGDPEYSSYLLNYQNLIIQDCTINNTEQEGMYIGSNTITDHQIYGTIKGNTVSNCGRDGIQFRNGIFNVHDNDIATVGTGGNDSHGAGILYGGGGGSSDINQKTWIVDNTVTDARVYGIFVNGYGHIWIEGNIVDSNIESALYCKNYESDTEDIHGIGFQYFTVKDNSFDSSDPTDPHAIDIRRDNAKCPVSVDLYTNTLVAGDLYIEDGVNGAAFGIVTRNL